MGNDTRVLVPRRSPMMLAVALIAVCVLTVAGGLPGLVGSTDRSNATSQQTALTAASAPNGKHVIAISVDGLNTAALTKLGRSRLPHLYRLIWDGAGTINARSQVEMTVTLPNHTSMVTGRRIDRHAGGHGVTWNDDTVNKTVHEAAGHDVSSVFRVVHRAGGTSAVFATKKKFKLFNQTWPTGVDRSVISDDDATAVRTMRVDLRDRRRDFYFLHLGGPDRVGHRDGWMTKSYLNEIRRVDALLGGILYTIRANEKLRRSTLVVLTSDHGGVPGTSSHGDPTRLANYRVAFTIWGPGVADKPLYVLNRRIRANPGTKRIGFSGVQPVRNGEVANVSLDLLGLSAVPGSIWNPRQNLRWR